ncbi:MAG TPA: hypothetical protein VEX65_02955 [Flavisolibacter sp.]|nr:hypothetical protein [Flavisolibacter sp.]
MVPTLPAPLMLRRPMVTGATSGTMQLQLKKPFRNNVNVTAIVTVEGWLNPQARPGTRNQFLQNRGSIFGTIFP